MWFLALRRPREYGQALMRLPLIEDALRDELVRLHRAVDALCAPLVEQHRERLSCKRGCSGCCRDELAVSVPEAARIVAQHGELLAHGTPHRSGACAFLDHEGACRIYAERPYVCRTQGLPLRWLEERAGETVELRDICELNDTGVPVTELSVEQCFTLGPVEARLLSLAARAGDPTRVALRALFTSEGLEGER